MHRSKPSKRTALEAVANHLSATLVHSPVHGPELEPEPAPAPEQGTGPSAATLLLGRKRIPVDIATLKPHGTLPPNAPTPRLRSDKVATRLINRLSNHLDQTLPAACTILLTLSAPIRLPLKTAASIEEKIASLLDVSLPPPALTDLVHGNHIHIHLSTNQPPQSPKLIAFVHNADADPQPLLNITHELLALLTTLGTNPSKTNANRFLVLISPIDSSALNLYRTAFAPIRAALSHSKIFIVFTDQTVVALAD